MKRKIAAIMAADVVGYSTLVAVDEENTIRRLEAARQVFDALVQRYGGRIFNTAGDAVLAEFPSAVEAVRCGLEIQESLRTKNLGVPEAEQMQFRLGINLGDVIERDGDLLGDGVNIAARLEGIAEPGGICISRAVFEQVQNKLAVDFASIGPQSVKNIPNPIHVYRVTPETTQPQASGGLKRWAVPVTFAAIVGLTAGATALLMTLKKQMATAPAEVPAVTALAKDVATPAQAAEIPPASPKPSPPAARAPQGGKAPQGETPPLPAREPAAVKAVPDPPAPAARAAAHASAEGVTAAGKAEAAPIAATVESTAKHDVSPPARAQSVSYTVALWCEKLAWTAGPLYQLDDITLTVEAGQAEYARPIHWPTLTSPVVGVETGTGKLGPKGRLVLDTQWASPARRFTARYEGSIDAKGGVLKGRQNWVSEGKPYTRPCVLRLTRI